MNIQWKTGTRKVADLKEWEENPRKITDTDFEKLKEGIKARGFHDVIKVDADNTILSGHQRKRALTDLGVEEVYVIYPDRSLTDEERKQVALESNIHRGKFDFDMLGNGFDVEMLLDLGMSKFELDLLPKPEKLEMDQEGLTKALDSYSEGNIKQIVLFFKNEDFDAVVGRFDEAGKILETDNHTETVLALLKAFEDEHTAS